MKLTRRQLAAMISSTATAASLFEASAERPAEAQPQMPTAGSTDEIEAARERIKPSSDLLAQHELPMATEPAFQFKA